jgi:hypothetical protein
MTLLRFYAATFRTGAPVLLVFPAVWIAAAVLEVMK